MKCDSKNVIYLISCKCYGKQYVGSVVGLKERFRIHKSDINTGKIMCGVASRLLDVCPSSASKLEYLQVQLENVSVYTKWSQYWQSFVGKRKILARAIIYVKPWVK